MKLIDKVKIHLKNGKSRQIRICNIPIIQYDVINGKKIKIYIPLLTKAKYDTSSPIFYLKINREDYYVLECLQQWLNVIDELHRDYVIICDNSLLEKKILRKLIFPNENIKIIKSNKNYKLQKYVKNIATKCWFNAAFAHLTTFYHAKMKNISHFWNIDADDTSFCLSTKELAEALSKVEHYANENNISAFSLDIWYNRTKQRHWSFGVTYVQNNVDWFAIFDKIKNNNWQNKYSDITDVYNLDWLFTYLKDYFNLNIQTFIFEKCYFIHWGNFLSNIIGSSIYYWNDKTLYFPHILEFYKDSKLGTVPIVDNCISFSLETHKTINDFRRYMYKNFSPLPCMSTQLKKLHCLENNIDYE